MKKFVKFDKETFKPLSHMDRPVLNNGQKYLSVFEYKVYTDKLEKYCDELEKKVYNCMNAIGKDLTLCYNLDIKNEKLKNKNRKLNKDLKEYSKLFDKYNKALELSILKCLSGDVADPTFDKRRVMLSIKYELLEEIEKSLAKSK